MSPTRDQVLQVLSTLTGSQGDMPSLTGMVRALTIEDGQIRFVLEAPDAAVARALEPTKAVAETALRALPGVTSVSIVTTAPTAAKEPPSLKIGRHPTPESGGGPKLPKGVARLLAVGSGKGGVGKSTVSSNLAVALARQGRKVGLLDADIYGPSQPRMMGVSKRPASPDGKIIMPLHAHGVTMMSLGLMLPEDEAVVWRGPMLMGALQQLLDQVAWGELDVLIVDLPPGTGDVQLTLCQRYAVTGAIVVSTPQDVALLDARKALSMFKMLKAPVLGLIENMSTFCCPQCGHESAIFGQGGVEAEAAKQDLPFLGALPISLDVRLAGDSGTPVAAGSGPAAEAYSRIAAKLVADGYA